MLTCESGKTSLHLCSARFWGALSKEGGVLGFLQSGGRIREAFIEVVTVCRALKGGPEHFHRRDGVWGQPAGLSSQQSRLGKQRAGAFI